MVDETSSDLVSFDADRAVDRATDVAGDDLRVVAEMTSCEYNVVYVSEAVDREFAATSTDFDDVAEELHRYEAIDFFEQRVFDDLLPTVETVTAFVTFTDVGILARVVTDADEGLFVSVERAVDVTALVDELEPIVSAA